MLRRWWFWAAAVLVIGAGVAAFIFITAEDTDDPTEVSPTPSASDIPGDSAQGLVDLMEEEGVICEEFEQLDAPQETLSDFGKCFLREGHEHETDIYVFADTEDRDLWVNTFRDVEGVSLLVGDTWLITNASVDELKDARAALGGEIIKAGA